MQLVVNFTIRAGELQVITASRHLRLRLAGMPGLLLAAMRTAALITERLGASTAEAAGMGWSAPMQRAASDWVHLARGLIDAVVGEAPGHPARLILAEVPARGLLGAMMPTAYRGKITLAGPAALVEGHRMVKIAADGGAAAADIRAVALPDLD